MNREDITPKLHRPTSTETDLDKIANIIPEEMIAIVTIARPPSKNNDLCLLDTYCQKDLEI